MKLEGVHYGLFQIQRTEAVWNKSPTHTCLCLNTSVLLSETYKHTLVQTKAKESAPPAGNHKEFDQINTFFYKYFFLTGLVFICSVLECNQKWLNLRQWKDTEFFHCGSLTLYISKISDTEFSTHSYATYFFFMCMCITVKYLISLNSLAPKETHFIQMHLQNTSSSKRLLKTRLFQLCSNARSQTNKVRSTLGQISSSFHEATSAFINNC